MMVLITGGAGYLGSILTGLFLDDGHCVTVFDRFNFGLNSLLHFGGYSGIDLIKGDVRDSDAVAQAVQKSQADAVVHLAAIVGYPACAADPALARSTNVDGTRNVIASLDDQKLVFASTGSTYGKVEGICDESTAINPVSLYGSTKWEAEKMVLEYGGIALRLATVFGVSPRMRLDLLVNDFVYQALHSRSLIMYEGDHRRTFMHVRDAARAFRWALDHYDGLKGRAYNIGSEKMNYTKRAVAQKIASKVDFYLDEAAIGEDLDQRDYEVSYELAHENGYSTTIDLDAGIDELIRFLRPFEIQHPYRNV